MKAFWSPAHRFHAPTAQFVAGRLEPYPEVPARVDRILDALEAWGPCEILNPQTYPEERLAQVHDVGLLRFLKDAHAAWRAIRPVADVGLIPDTFAVRALKTRPENLVWQSGYYCFETQTPIFAGTYEAAVRSAWCALSGAEALLGGDRYAYALCRPPGHHAGHDLYGGYCYLNNAALAASRLLEGGRTAILDLDFHHGNGTQDIFYEREDVDFVSLHAHPDRKYPYFTGRGDEAGSGDGLGHNRNIPLGPGVGPEDYYRALEDALAWLGGRRPAYLVLSLGVDTCDEDPLGDFCLPRQAFWEIGRRVGASGLPVLVVQEGGYSLDAVGECVTGTLASLAEAEPRTAQQGPDRTG